MHECNYCTRTFRTRNACNQHMDDIDHWANFECDHCYKVFGTAQGRKSHTDAVHRSQRYRSTATAWTFSTPVVTAAPTELVPAKQETAPNRLEQFHDGFLDNTASMFNKKDYSDSAVVIQDVILYIHQLVVCLQSPYLSDALQKASESTGVKSLTFKEGSAIAHWRVFEFLYTGDYSDSPSISAMTDDPDLLKDVRVYALAPKFLLEDLQMLALGKLQRQLAADWSSKALSMCIKESYSADNGDDCRDAVIQVAATHFRKLATDTSFRKLLWEGGDFACDYLIKIHQRSSSLFRFYRSG